MNTLKIRDNENGIVFEYGSDKHHSLRISEDGKSLTFENLKNGDGSVGGGYSFVLEDGKTPEESDSSDAMYGCTYANIGGFKNTSDGWIPCDKQMPEEHDSMFAKWKGTERWSNAMFEKISKDVNVTVEYEDATRNTITMHTLDGKWNYPNRVMKQKAISWKPLPEPDTKK